MQNRLTTICCKPRTAVELGAAAGFAQCVVAKFSGEAQRRLPELRYTVPHLGDPHWDSHTRWLSEAKCEREVTVAPKTLQVMAIVGFPSEDVPPGDQCLAAPTQGNTRQRWRHLLTRTKQYGLEVAGAAVQSEDCAWRRSGQHPCSSGTREVSCLRAARLSEQKGCAFTSYFRVAPHSSASRSLDL